jgi:hypothetical protein
VILYDELKDQSPRRRYHAALFLGSMKAAYPIGPLRSLLSDKDSAVRWAAIYSIGVIGHKEGIKTQIVEALIQALNDDNKYNREVALSNLSAITGKDFGFDQDKWDLWHKEFKKESGKRSNYKSLIILIVLGIYCYGCYKLIKHKKNRFHLKFALNIYLKKDYTYFSLHSLTNSPT